MVVALRSERALSLQYVLDIEQLAKSFGARAALEFGGTVVVNGESRLTIPIFGEPASLRDILKELDARLPPGTVGAWLVVRQVPLRLPELNLAPSLTNLERGKLEAFLAEIMGNIEANTVRLVNDPQLGTFIGILPISLANEYLAAATIEGLDDITGVASTNFDVEKIVVRDFIDAIAALREGTTRIILRRAGAAQLAMVSFAELEDYQKLNARANRRFLFPYIQVPGTDIREILDSAPPPAIEFPAPIEPPPSPPIPLVEIDEASLMRTVSVVDIYLYAKAKNFLQPDSALQLTLQKPIVQITFRRKVVALALSIEAASEMHIEQIADLYQRVAGQPLPQQVRSELEIYRRDRRQSALDRRAPSFTSQNGPVLFEDLTKKPNLIVFAGRPRVRILTPKMDDVFILLPVLSDAAAADVPTQEAGDDTADDATDADAAPGSGANTGQARAQRSQKIGLSAGESIDRLLEENMVPVPGVLYELTLPDSSRYQVRFDKSVIRELFTDPSARRNLLSAFIRSLKKGFVSFERSAGIRRHVRIHPKLVEVRLPHSLSSDWILGCLEGPVLEIKRLALRSVGSRSGLDEFKNLCK